MRKFVISVILTTCLSWSMSTWAQTQKVEPINRSAPINSIANPKGGANFGLWNNFDEFCIGLYGLSGFRDIDFGGYLGRFFGPFYIEGYISGGALKAKDVSVSYYDYNQGGAIEIIDSYQSLNYGFNLGLGLQIDDFYWKLIPYVGMGFGHAIGDRLTSGKYSDSTAPISGLSIIMNTGIRCSYCATYWLEIFIAPEYRFSVFETDFQSSLCSVSKTIQNWGNSFKLNFGVGFYF